MSTCRCLLLLALCTLYPSWTAAETSSNGDAPVEAKKPASAAAGKPVLLRYRFKANQFWHYEVVHEMLVRMQAQGIEETTKNTTVSKQHLRVVSVDKDGGAILEPTLDHVRMRSQFDDNSPTLFDSDDPNEQPPQFARVLESIGKPQGRQRVDALGKIILGSDTTESMSASPLLMVLPEQPVAVGATWDEDYTVNVRISQKLQRPIKLRRKFTLSQLKGDTAEIEFKTIEIDNPQDPEIRAQLIQMTPTGHIRFDIKRGVIVSKRMHSDKREFDIAGGAMRAVSDRSEKLVTSKR